MHCYNKTDIFLFLKSITIEKVNKIKIKIRTNHKKYNSPAIYVRRNQFKFRAFFFLISAYPNFATLKTETYNYKLLVFNLHALKL